MNQKELNWSLKRSSIHCSFYFNFFMGLKHHLLRYSDKLNEFSMLLCFGVMSPLPRLGSLPLSPHVTFWCFPLPPFLGWRHLWTVPKQNSVSNFFNALHIILLLIYLCFQMTIIIFSKHSIMIEICKFSKKSAPQTLQILT